MKPPKDPRARLAEIEAKIARLQRKANGGLTCCAEIGGIRSRSQKRKNQIADSRVSASVALCKLYPLRDRLLATVARLDRGEPEPVAPVSILDAARRLKPARVRRVSVLTHRLPPTVTALCGSAESANAYMEGNPDEGLLAEMPDGKCYMARLDDMGELVTQEEFEACRTALGEAIMRAAMGF